MACGAMGVPVFQALASLLSMFAVRQSRPLIYPLRIIIKMNCTIIRTDNVLPGIIVSV